MAEKYTDDSIRSITAMEHIRLRPEMYLGSVANARNVLLLDALCLSLAEAHCGTCSAIEIHASGRSVRVSDNGMGLSLKKSGGITFAESIFTQMRTCRNHKAHQALGDTLCGVGMAVVNAFSEHLSVDIHCDGKLHRQTHQLGIPDGPFQIVGDTSRTGTELRFTISEQFVGAEAFDLPALRESIYAKPIDLSRTTITITEGP